MKTVNKFLAELRVGYLALLYGAHLKIRYLHDRVYQGGGWYKKWNDKSYSTHVHKATLLAFVISFAFFTVVQGLFPTLFNPAVPGIALANYQTWSSRGDFLSGIGSNTQISGNENGDDAAVSLFQNQVDTDYGFEIGTRDLEDSSTTAVNITETTDSAFYSGLSNGLITKRSAIGSMDIGLVTSFDSDGVFNTNTGAVINDIDLTPTHLFYAVTYSGNQWRVGKITQAAGVPDATFGVNGVLDINPSSGNDLLYAMALDANYIYLVGNDFTPGNNQWRIEKRSITTGELEATFGTGGVVTTNPSNGSDNLRAITIDSTHMYLAGSDALPVNNEWRIEKRSLATGELDTSFDGDGIITYNPGSGSDIIINDCLIVENGYLWVMGVDAGPGNGQWHLEKRSAATGALETNFDGDGIYTYNPSSTSEALNSASIYDGYIYLGGYDHSLGSTNAQWRIEKRSVTDGVLDTGFGTGGVLLLDVSNLNDRINDLEAKRDGLYLSGFKGSFGYYSVRSRVHGGGITLSGISTNPTESGDRLYDVVADSTFFYSVGYQGGSMRVEKRYIAGGALDQFFGAGGVVSIDVYPNADVANSVVLEGDYLYVAGYLSPSVTNSIWSVQQINAVSGTLGWNYVNNPTTGADRPESIVYDDGYLYVSGSDTPGTGNTRWRIEKLDLNGVLDTTFGENGVITADPSSGQDYIYGSLVNYNYLYLCGLDRSPGNNQWRIEKRLKTTGELVSGFGTNGVINSNPNPVENSGSDYAYSMVIVGSNLYIGGQEGPAYGWRLESRSTGTGALNTGFGSNGVITEDGPSLDTLYELKTDGSYLYLSGALTADPGGDMGFRIEKRSLTTGEFVQNFGTNGYLQLGPTSSGDAARALVLANNYLIAVGYDGSSPGATDFGTYIVKYSKNYSASGGDSGYVSPGTIIGFKVNAGDGIKPWWKNITWNGNVPQDTTITFATRGADTEGELTVAEWSSFGTGASLATPATQWLEIQVKLTTNNSAVTPRLDDFTVNYDVLTLNQSDMFMEFNGSEIQAGAYINDYNITLGARNLACLSDINTCYIEVERNKVDKAFDGIGVSAGSEGTTSGVSTKAVMSGVSHNPQKWRARLKDASGRVGAWVEYPGDIDWNNDFYNPNGTISIENNSAYTKGVQVHLNLTNTEVGNSGVAQMRFSNNKTEWSAWEPYAAAKVWTLSSGDGQKNVYVQYKDNAGNVSGTRWVTTSDFINNSSTTGETVSYTNATVSQLNPVSEDCPTCFARIDGTAGTGYIGGSGSIGLRYAAPQVQSWIRLNSISALNSGQYLKFSIRTSNDGVNWSNYLGRNGQEINWDTNYFGSVYPEAGYFDLTNIPDSRYLDIAVRFQQVVTFTNIGIESATVASIELDNILPETDFVSTKKYPDADWDVKEGTSTTEFRFNTNRDALVYIDYGIGSNITQAGGDPDYKQVHELSLKNLRSGTTYNYSLRLIDRKKNIVKYPLEGYYTFTTGKTDIGFEGDPTASNLSQVEITASTAKITWKTKVPTSSWVDYGLTNSYGNTAGDDALLTAHIVELKNLVAGETYHYRVRGLDSGDNEFVSNDFSFKAIMNPEISNVKVDEVTPYTARVTWTTNVKTDSDVAYGETTTYSNRSKDPGLLTSHSVRLDNLTDNVTYHFQVEARDEYGNATKSQDYSFTTPLDTVGPKISDVRIDMLPMAQDEETATIIISWKTDKAATTQVFYDEGLVGTKLARATTFDKSLNKTHTVIIRELSPGVTYRFRIVSGDKRDNMTSSNDYNFVTPVKEKSILQLIVQSLQETFGWVRNTNSFFRGLIEKAK